MHPKNPIISEQWKPVAGYEHAYEVSDRGRVRSLDRSFRRGDGRRVVVRGRVLHPSHDSFGYLQVSLSVEGRRVIGRVHRLVAEAFVLGRGHGMIALHNDGNHLNNDATNLRWGTYADNAQDAVKHGTHANMRDRSHCAQGHPYDEPNTYVRPGGLARDCKECKRQHNREWYARSRAARQRVSPDRARAAAA